MDEGMKIMCTYLSTKRPYRIINKKVTEFCRLRGGHYFFSSEFLFLPSMEHFKLGTCLAPNNVKMSQPLTQRNKEGDKLVQMAYALYCVGG